MPKGDVIVTHGKSGGADRDRTGDPLLAKQVLSQLSYSPACVVFAPLLAKNPAQSNRQAKCLSAGGYPKLHAVNGGSGKI